MKKVFIFIMFGISSLGFSADRFQSHPDSEQELFVEMNEHLQMITGELQRINDSQITMLMILDLIHNVAKGHQVDFYSDGAP